MRRDEPALFQIGARVHRELEEALERVHLAVPHRVLRGHVGVRNDETQV